MEVQNEKAKEIINELSELLFKMCSLASDYEKEIFGFYISDLPKYQSKNFQDFLEDLEDSKTRCLEKIHYNIYSNDLEHLLSLINKKEEEVKRHISEKKLDEVSEYFNNQREIIKNLIPINK